MKCIHCGNEFKVNGNFCPYCGKEIKAEVVQNNEQKPHIKKCFYVFAKVGYGLGLGAFIASFIPFFNFFAIFVGIAGIVFSALGNRTNPTKSGLKFSIAAVIISIVAIILMYVVLFGAIFSVYNSALNVF